MRMSHDTKEQELKNNYLREHFGGEDAHLQKIRHVAGEHNREGMQVSPVEGRLLQSLVAWTGARSVVEFGLLFGYSCLWMARALPDDGVIYSLEKDPAMLELATKHLQETEVWEKCQLIGGDAEETMLGLDSKGPFDLVFIDANKGSYLKYLEWAEKNVRKGGFIVGDNTFLFGHVYGGSSEERWGQKQIDGMREFNARLADPGRYQSTLIPTQEGLTVAQKLF